VSDEDLVRHYQAADAFVLPTTAMEGFGISTVEALSANLPAIGTPAGATPEILNSIDPRLLTSDTTAEGIAAGITSWLGWRSEDDGTTRYRDEVMEKYAWPKVVELIEAYYEEVLGAFEPAL
jgi:glycosyltransferase involved in cell wall biosynthesis